MQYNLLNYGNSANPPGYKNARLATIAAHVQPDVLGVNEVFSNPALLDSILTALGPGWAHAAFSNMGNETQTNGLFYKTSTFLLRSQAVVSNTLRDIIAYRLQYRDTITHPHDTVFLTVVIAHLKSSPGSAEEAQRAAETQTIASYLATRGAGNYVVMGDLNVYSSSEACYQNLVNSQTLSSRLYDPIARPGAWSGDASFADIHTQSPRIVTTLGDGGVAGGLDDRFDQILVSGAVMQDGAGIKYLPGSYTTVGQDGQHFNGALTAAPANTAAPATVVQALYELSDHLPVAASFILHPEPISTGIAHTSPLSEDVVTYVVNPVEGWLEIGLGAALNGESITVTLYSIDGRPVWRSAGPTGGGKLREFVGGEVAPGMYLLTVESSRGRIVQRVVVR